MSSVFTILITLALLGTQTRAATIAGSNCTDLHDLLELVSSCQRNPFVVNAAAACLQDFEARIQAAQTPLSDSLVAPVTHAGDGSKIDRQTHSFDFNSSNHALSVETLSQLIAFGKISREEMNQFMRHLIVYFTTQGNGFDMDDPGVISELSEDGCYGDNRAELLKLLSRMDHDLGDLANARAASQGLKAMSDSHSGSLSAVDPNFGGGAATLRGFSGPNTNATSDVTGIAQDKAKQLSVNEAVGAGAGIAAPHFGAASTSPRDRASGVTSGTVDLAVRGHPQGLSRNLVPSGVFSRVGSLETQGARATAARTHGRDEANSVGEAIWNDNSGGGAKDLELGLASAPIAGTDAAAGASPSATASLTDAAAEGASSAPGFSRAPSSTASPGGSSAQASTAVASADSDLFRLVHDRYRETELFRKARVSTVPLSGFDSRLNK